MHHPILACFKSNYNFKQGLNVKANVILCYEYIYFQIITHLYQYGSDEPEFIYFFKPKKSYFMFVTAVVI